MGPAFSETLRTYIRAGYPILYVVTAEEDRAIELAGKAIAEGELARRKLFIWSVSRRLCTTDLKVVDRKTAGNYSAWSGSQTDEGKDFV